ncbi:glutathione S-transferase family protein [Aquidulcibacter sp.]|jgi:GST-like protein|uniref:glutathione S-transferase family protein n=1 Tax=Aquidulcibacter sp. TaxID=2052990 RepID=UPI0022C3EF50|nr:glutathione binding-like protein [Aquidulcibacter sp.]MCE2890569.1 glutathione binding-like protein [Hyphomonadaceae bacterium]MCZ8209118.1 glutathione binding-like protein [Aquidulcibacter sp.]
MIRVYSWQTPNPKKVILLLEELGLPYQEIMIDPLSDAVRSDGVLAASPNAKIPAIVDEHGPTGLPHTVFESGAILIYLAEKAGSDLLPRQEPDRSTTFQWLMWQMAGIGPMIGQYFHFTALAPEKLDYPISRYQREMHRLLTVLNAQLSQHAYVVGANYTIADIAIFPWVAALPPLLSVDFTPYPHVQEWVERLQTRPAVQRAYPQPQQP